MTLEIITPDKSLFRGNEISLVQMPCLDGLFEVLENHAPMIAALKEGKIKVVDQKNETLWFEIKGGIAEILNNKVLVLAS